MTQVATKQARLYARVSGNSQAEKHTIQSQVSAFREQCQLREYTFSESNLYLDDPAEGATPFDERPAGKRLLETPPVEPGEVVVILCVDRLGRDVEEGIIAYRQLRSAGFTVEFISQSFDDSPEGTFTFQVFLAVAELERKTIAKRTKMGRQRSAREGRWPASRAPYGYTRNGDGRLEKDPDTAETVELIFRRARDVGCVVIARELNERGAAPPSGGPQLVTRRNGGRCYVGGEWNPNVLGRILHNRVYTGAPTYSGVTVTVPAYITEAEFEYVKQQAARRKDESRRNTKRLYLLQHKLFCGRCGGRYASEYGSGDRSYYVCRLRREFKNRVDHTGVAKWRWRADELEVAVMRNILELLASPRELLRRSEVYAELAKETTRDPDRQKELKGLLGGFEQESQRLVHLATKGLIEATEFARERRRINNERRQTERELTELENRPVVDAEFVADAFDEMLQGKLFAGLRGLPPDVPNERIAKVLARHQNDVKDWRELVADIIDRVTIKDDGQVEVSYVFDVTESLPSYRANLKDITALKVTTTVAL